jgi:hypothetical protein
LTGVLAVLVAAGHLVLLRGAQPGTILLFGLPLLIAVQHLRSTATVGERIAAGSFLALIAIGAVVARDPGAFPNLGGIAKNGLAPRHDRMLAWYTGVYLIFLFTVVPWFVFGRALRQQSRGESARFSRATCYLGVGTSFLMALSLPQILGTFLGFWPIQ